MPAAVTSTPTPARTSRPANNLSVTVNNSAVVASANFAVIPAPRAARCHRRRRDSPQGRGSRPSRSDQRAGVSSGKLDLTNNRLIVDYTPGQPIVSIRQQLTRGYNAGGPPWAGTASSARRRREPDRVGLGYGEASRLLGPSRRHLRGRDGGLQPPFSSATPILGDATLDGAVDFIDLVKLAQNTDHRHRGHDSRWWNQGDFTYDGNVDFIDLVKVAQNYNTALPSRRSAATTTFEQDLAAAFAWPPSRGFVFADRGRGRGNFDAARGFRPAGA